MYNLSNLKKKVFQSVRDPFKPVYAVVVKTKNYFNFKEMNQPSMNFNTLVNHSKNLSCVVKMQADLCLL